MTEVSPETRERGLSLCRQFLGKSWAKISPDDFYIERIHGGLSNIMYLCAIKDHFKLASKEEPRKVILRLYGQILRENPETIVIDSVVFALLAERGMGPGLYGMFTGGRVEEYVKSRTLRTEELQEADISMASAKIMGEFHKLTMPLCKEPTWLFDTMTRYLDEALNNLSFQSTDPGRRDLVQKLLSYNLASELQCLKQILSKVHSPVVFCHNDLQEGNILFSEKNGKWQLIPIDFEYASYNYRGFDIGNHFCEWCYDYHHDEAPYYKASLANYPTRDQQLIFIRQYLQTYGSGDIAAEETQVLDEVAAYSLASHFLWGLWSILQSHMSNINFGYMEYSVVRFEDYFTQKAALPAALIKKKKVPTATLR